MDSVSAFIVGTSPVHPKLYRGLLYSDVFHSMQFHNMSEDKVPHRYFQCGSSLEFYVELMNSCIDDIDTMISKADEMAFTEDIPVLPDDVSVCVDMTNCLQITPYPDY